MNRVNVKGQALVEFVLVLPVIMMILFVIIDLANVFYNKNKLETTTDTIIMYKKNNDNYRLNKYIKDEDVSYKITNNNGEDIIEVKKDIVLSTPFSNLFFDNPYTIKAKRVIIDE